MPKSLETMSDYFMRQIHYNEDSHSNLFFQEVLDKYFRNEYSYSDVQKIIDKHNHDSAFSYNFSKKVLNE